MDTGLSRIGDDIPGGFKQTRIHDIGELEAGAYWGRLQPYFMRPCFRRLTYQLAGKSWRDRRVDEVLSVRGASGFGDLDVAYVADRCATDLFISETGPR